MSSEKWRPFSLGLNVLRKDAAYATNQVGGFCLARLVLVKVWQQSTADIDWYHVIVTIMQGEVSCVCLIMYQYIFVSWAPFY